jgi:hypothetical protein
MARSAELTKSVDEEAFARDDILGATAPPLQHLFWLRR